MREELIGIYKEAVAKTLDQQVRALFAYTRHGEPLFVVLCLPTRFRR